MSGLDKILVLAGDIAALHTFQVGPITFTTFIDHFKSYKNIIHRFCIDNIHPSRLGHWHQVQLCP